MSVIAAPIVRPGYPEGRARSGPDLPESDSPQRAIPTLGHRFGYKAHVATDQDAGLIRGVEVTTANAHDASELEAILPDAPGDTYGDSAYQGDRPEGIIRARGSRRRVVHTAGLVARQRQSGCERQCRSPPRAVPDREGVRHRQAIVWAAPDALAGIGKGQPAGFTQVPL